MWFCDYESRGSVVLRNIVKNFVCVSVNLIVMLCQYLPAQCTVHSVTAPLTAWQKTWVVYAILSVCCNDTTDVLNNMGICFGMDSFDNEYCISCELTQSGECLGFPQQSKTTTKKKKSQKQKMDNQLPCIPMSHMEKKYGLVKSWILFQFYFQLKTNTS